ncbi:MAG: hypothetical protein D5R98_04990 [Desulfonatronovibrio sp. MSAO_Bac4]|nr:MAG: hypothetical protein D5R98_04990 [Desulfonatronovibrio sp. MSAO_Bac4]
MGLEVTVFKKTEKFEPQRRKGLKVKDNKEDIFENRASVFKKAALSFAAPRQMKKFLSSFAPFAS